MLTLEEIKNYLRVDDTFDDQLIQHLYDSAYAFCLDVARCSDRKTFDAFPNSRIALLYVVAYFYEHREKADHQELALTLRALLFGVRKEMF